MNLDKIKIVILLFYLFLKPTINYSQCGDIFVPPKVDPNYINCIAIEGDYIWCGTYGGVVRWDRRDVSYKRYTTDDGLQNIYVTSSAVDSSGVKWFGYGYGGGGVASFDDIVWTTYTPYNSGLSGKKVLCLTVDHNNV